MSNIIIAGGGIGGLVTALCLRRAGHPVRIYERTKKLVESGSGFNLQPYCTKLLYELGLRKELDEFAIRTEAVAFYSRHGKFICQDTRGISAGFKWPMYSLHRGRFQQVLVRHLRDEMGEDVIQLGVKLVAFRSHSDHVDVDFINTATGEPYTERGKALIGADGINSSVRKILYPDEGNSLWDGVIIWRGVTSLEKTPLDGRTVVFIGNPDTVQVIIYPIDQHRVNWTCTVRVEPPGVRTLPVAADWTKIGRIDEVLPHLADMKVDFLDLNHLISSANFINKFKMSDRDPLPRWSHGLVTLLGDAAHPLYPNGGNGASQAITDSRSLVLAFREHGVTAKGLQMYDDLRRKPSSVFIMAGRQRAHDEILRFVDKHAPSGFQNLDDVISPSELKAMLDKYKQLLDGWSAPELNQQPPAF